MIFFLPRKSTSMITKIELRTSKILGSNIVTDFVKPATCAIWDEMWKKKIDLIKYWKNCIRTATIRLKNYNSLGDSSFSRLSKILPLRPFYQVGGLSQLD